MFRSHESLTNSALVAAAVIVSSIVFPQVVGELDKFSMARDRVIGRTSITPTGAFAEGQFPISSWIQVNVGGSLKHIPDPVALVLGQAQKEMPATTGTLQFLALSGLSGSLLKLAQGFFDQVEELHQQEPVETEETAEFLDSDG